MEDGLDLFADGGLFGEFDSDHEFFGDEGNDIILLDVFLGPDDSVAGGLLDDFDIFEEAIIGFEVLEELLELILSRGNFCFPGGVLLGAP